MSSNTKLAAGQSVYIKNKNTKLLKFPVLSSEVIAVLQPMERVIWLGQASGAKEFHQVRHKNLVGYTYFSNLTKSSKPAEYHPLVCQMCKGAGYLPVPGINEAQWGNNFVHPVCPQCGGDGRPPIEPVFASSGTGTKA